MSTSRLILKREDWPGKDRAAWDVLFEEGDIFDDRGPCSDWSAGSRRKRGQNYGYWLGFLTRADMLDASASPADRFTSEAVSAFVENMRARVSLITTSMQIIDLYILKRSVEFDLI